ncbi:unnamed protein product [Parnassius mnemosyne]|uniref:Ubiquitin-like protease family profile domain-containing protein n=1 Tax=Parnassius mnemosyne TaxID=213953 RepID=A0AAV1LLP6_9NEOP
MDTDDKPGSHWVALYIDTNDVGQYFDSYGRSPVRYHLEFLKRNCKRWNWNVDRIQNEDATSLRSANESSMFSTGLVEGSNDNDDESKSVRFFSYIATY